MMRYLRQAVLLALLLTAAALVAVLAIYRTQTPLKSTLAPLFQALGKPAKIADNALAGVTMVDALDEQEYGARVARFYDARAKTPDPDSQYVNRLLKNLSPFAKKPFNYRVYMVDSPAPNAMALPGGVIIVTRGLLSGMKTEAEVASVLAHEMGHIEMSHCLKAVKYELLLKKMGSRDIGQIADFVNALFLRHSFSKTEEAEADDYAFELILLTRYDPAGVGHAFTRLEAYQRGRSYRRSADGHADVMRDYFMSHPPLALRKEKYGQKAAAWRAKHPDEQRLLGRENLKKRICAYQPV